MVQISTFSKKWSILFLGIAMCLTSITQAQPYINGNLSTGATSSNGTAAPAGFTWSELQNGNTNLGFGGSIAGNLALVDDFTVPAGQIWNLTNILLYAYSTGYSNTVSPFNDLRIQIYNTDPSLGNATPIFGDLTTSRFVSSASANIYRIGFGTTGTTRQVWGIIGNVTTTLNPGHYWIEWQTATITGVTSNFTPTSTVVGTVSQPGNNAWQHNLQTNAWTPVVDQTSSTRQDFPWLLNYTVTVPPACSGTPNPGNTLTTNTTVCAGQDFTLSLQNNPVVSGLTYQWQSSPNGTAWTNIAGATGETYDATQASNTYYRCLVTCGANTAPSNPVLVSMYTSFVTAQPANTSAGCSGSASFRIVTGGTSPVLGYQWQQRANASAVWANVTNTNLIKGANDDTLTFLIVPAGLNGYQFRALYIDTCENVYASDSAILTVTPITATVTPSSASVCNNVAQMLSLSGTQNTRVIFNSGAINPPLTIPDTVKAGVTNTLAVSGIPAGATITSISVTVNANHPYAGDLAMSVKSPNNSVINLNYYLSGTGAGPSATGFVNSTFSSNGSVFVGDSSDPYTGVFRADAVVSPQANFPAGPNSMPPTTGNWDNMYSNPNGNWVLGLYDGFTGDVGTLNSWTIEFTYSLPATGVWTSTATGSIYTDASATTAYTAGNQANTVYVKPSSDATYSVVTSTTDCGSSAPATANITIQQAIANVTSPSDATVCAGNAASYTVSAALGTNIAYQWQSSSDGGNTWQNISGATSTTLNVASGVYPNGTLFRAVLSNGCGAPFNSNAASYTVLSGPSITAQPADAAACANNQVTYSVNAPGSTSYQWQVSTNNGATWNDITTGGNTSSYSFTAASGDNGNLYRVVVGACGINLNSASATLTILSAASITTQPASTTVCAGSTATISANAAGSSYQWQVSTDNGATWSNVAGANTTTLSIPSAAISLSGNQYRLAIGSCGASTVNTNAATLTVNEPASITTQPAAFSACAGANASVSVAAGGTGISYQWQVSTDNGTTWNDISGATSSSYAITGVNQSANGNRYRVIVNGTAPCGSVTSNAVALTVNPLPNVGAGVTPSDIVCAGTNITLSGTGAVSYTWSNGVNNGVPFSINNSAAFTVTGTDANGCQSTDNISIVVNSVPTVSITSSAGTSLQPGASTTLTATSNPTASGFTWYRNGQVVSGATGSSLNVTYNGQSDLGNYYAVGTTSDGCSGQSSSIEITASNLAFISPNPSTGSFQVYLPVQAGNRLNRIVSLYDSKGALVFQRTYPVSGNSPIQVVTSALNSGVYVLEVHDSNGNRLATDRLIITGN